MVTNGENEESSGYQGISAEWYAQGWRRTLQEAIDAAMDEQDTPVGGTVVIDAIEVKRVRRNPIHDYRVSLR